MIKIPIYFSEILNSNPADTDSPSPEKPAKVMRFWENKFASMISRKTPSLDDRYSTSPERTLADLNEIHDPKFVKSVLDGVSKNGFDNYDQKVAQAAFNTVELYAESCEDFFLRAASPLEDSKLIACCPVSGFHHACYDQSMGFCTFNGLMAAARRLAKSGLVVGIIDCDYHYGNGTDNILSTLKDPWVSNVKHYTAGRYYQTLSKENMEERSDEFMLKFPMILEFFKNCEVILYQAGADPHRDDPYGGFLTTEQLLKRDEIVFKFCVENNIQCMWNLAGGYQRNADGTTNWDALFEIHTNTLKAAHEAVNAVETQNALAASFFPDLQDL